MPENGGRRSLVRGEVIEHMPPGGIHGKIALRLGMRLQQWVEAGNHGIAGVESGFILSHTPDIVRSPDLFFVSAARIPEGGEPEAFWDQAPDLAVEVVAPSESAEDVPGKVREYISAGTRLTWVVYPRTREVMVHTADGTIRVFHGDDLLRDEAVLPGFSCRVDEIFG